MGLAVAFAAVLANSAFGEIKTLTFASTAVGGDVRYLVDLPESYASSERSYPVVYVLHGLFESSAFWERRGLAPIYHELVSKKEIPEAIVVVVDGGNSFFVNAPAGRYEDLVVKDLLAHVESTYRVLRGREGRVLLGVSMGGYGALRIAFEHPEAFAAVATHSAMLLLKVPAKEDGAGQWHMEAFHGVFGDPIDAFRWSAADPLELVKKADAARLPALSIDCGASDRFGLFAGNEELHRRLAARGIAHEFALPPGDHGYEYVRSVLPKSLRFLARHLSPAATLPAARR
jgi:enterochelin esterase family protein